MLARSLLLVEGRKTDIASWRAGFLLAPFVLLVALSAALYHLGGIAVCYSESCVLTRETD